MNGHHKHQEHADDDSNRRAASVLAERIRLEEECSVLRTKLAETQQKRRHMRNLIDTPEVPQQWLLLQGESERDRQLALEEYQSAVTAINYRRRWLNLAEKWNVTNDCFHIWHRGPFGTINGLRLASEVPSIPSVLSNGDESVGTKISDHVSSNGGSQSTSAMPSLVGSRGTMVSGTPVEASNGSNAQQQPIPENVRVPWVEINSALGLVVLLLSTLEKKPHSGIKYHNKLVPQGSTSKIGVRKGESVTFYNLYSDDSFQFFGKRSFNIALNGLLRCLQDAGHAVKEIDRTIALPHPVESVAGGLLTVGGLSVAYGPDGEQWTRAMKYVLTDAKWLVAFTTKHVDR
jgi:hypothetical protein